MNSLLLYSLNSFISILVLMIVCVFSVEADDRELSDLNDQLSLKYNDSSELEIPELTKDKINEIEQIWHIFEAIEILNHSEISLNEDEVALLERYLEPDEYGLANGNKLLERLDQSLNKRIELSKLREIEITQKYILSPSNNAGRHEFEIKSIGNSIEVYGVKFKNKDCEKIETSIYTCDSQVNESISSVSVKPLEILVQLKLPFWRQVLSKFLGANESLIGYELPVFEFSQKIGEIQLLANQFELSKESKQFSFPISYRNQHCKTGTRKFTYDIPEEYSIDGAPAFSGKVDGQINFRLVNKNKIEASVYIKNSGQCVKLLGTTVAYDGRGTIRGTVSVKATKSVEKTSEKLLYAVIVQWESSVIIDKDGLDYVGGKLIYNSGQEVLLSNTNLIEVNETAETVTIIPISFNQQILNIVYPQ
jgi:hypothetical protein